MHIGLYSLLLCRLVLPAILMSLTWQSHCWYHFFLLSYVDRMSPCAHQNQRDKPLRYILQSLGCALLVSFTRQCICSIFILNCLNPRQSASRRLKSSQSRCLHTLLESSLCPTCPVDSRSGASLAMPATLFRICLGRHFAEPRPWKAGDCSIRLCSHI